MFLWRISVLFFISCPKGSQSARWSGTVSDGDRKYACNGHDITLDWRYTLDPGESLEDIKWFFRGQSEELIATYLHNQFFSSPPFARRVQFVDNAGLTISPVTVGNSGNYSVVVTVLSSFGSVIRLSSHIFLDVRDRLLTNDGGVHLSQNPVAVRDPQNNQMSLELWCGDFTYNGIPPFNVSFMNPQGQVLPATAFRDHHYTLLLSSPIEDGTYTCRIPSNQYDEACLQGDNAHELAEDSLVIVGCPANIKLLQAENADLRQTCLLYGGGSTCNSGGEGISTTPALSLGGGGEGRPTPVAFYAEMRPTISTDMGERPMRSGDVFVFDNVQLNVGLAYNSQTGIFVAPVAGIYYFTVLISSWALSTGAATGTNDHSVGFCIHADGASPDGFLKCVYSPLAVATESFQHQLHPGNRVWVAANFTTGFVTIYNAKMAHFSAFLVDSQAG